MKLLILTIRIKEFTDMQKVFISWSGGKDSCYSCYKAIQNGMDVRFLMNMMNENGTWSFVHRFPLSVLQQQSDALDIRLLHHPTGEDPYAVAFTRTIEEMKKDGIEGGVFGDIDLDEHREWVENICHESGIEACLPLWGMSQDDVMTGFLGLGFVAIIIACNEKYLGEEWLGRKVDEAFISHLKEVQKTTDITVCGESGEYHTLVIDGPIFKKCVEIQETVNRYNNGYWFLEIQKSELKDK
jgi:diphthine-ammonia ligase